MAAPEKTHTKCFSATVKTKKSTTQPDIEVKKEKK